MSIDKVTEKRHVTIAEERISVIFKKSGEQKLLRNCRNYLNIEVISNRNREGMQQQLNTEDSTRSGKPHKVSGSDARYLKMHFEKIHPH
jgi:hypothetical protein